MVAQCPIPNALTNMLWTRCTKTIYTWALTLKGEGVIAEPLNLTVSLRGTREVRDNCQLFRLTGLLDAFSEPTFRKVIGSKIDDGPKNIILDLSQIDFVDSSGLGALVQLAKQSQTNEGTLQIVTNARVTQTVKLVRLEKFLALQPSVDAALGNIPGQN
jgi:anti-anti-sigma factor